MKMKIVKRGVRLLCVLCLSTCLVSSSIAQSGKTVEPVKIAPVQETEADRQLKPVEIPIPKAKYEYLAPQHITQFMLAVKEAGKRGFRLDKVTAVPSGAADTSREKAASTVLAGILRFDGESQYDYNFFFAETDKTPDDKLNGLGLNGWYFLDVISVYGSGIDDNETFANSVYGLPSMGNLYLLERRLGAEKSTPSYKLLKAGARLGANPTEKMKGLLDAAIAEGYTPVATYYSFNIKNIFSVDSFFGVLVGKVGDQSKLEYKFVRSNRSDGLRKEIDLQAKDGWRIRSVNFNTAILVRDAGQAQPVAYQWLETDDKKYPTELAAAMSKNPRFVSGGIDLAGDGTYIKNIIIFEQTPTNAAAKYQFAKMLPRVPKQFKKNPQDYLKTLEKPEAQFQKLLDEGYAPRDLYYSDIEGLTVVFESAK